MTWRKFAKAIRDAQITKDVPWRIIDDLFKAAGYTEGLLEPTVRSWLKEKRNCDGRRYFPNKEIETKEVFDFFRKSSEKKLQNLQKIFREETDPDSPINVETNNLDIFCWSLVNQFLDLLGFQCVGIPESALSAKEPESVPSVEEPVNAPSVKDKKTAKRFVKSLFLPHSTDDCCYHCAYWVGDRTTFGAYTTETYGFCRKYNRQEQLSSDLACKDHKKRKKSPLEW